MPIVPDISVSSFIFNVSMDQEISQTDVVMSNITFLDQRETPSASTVASVPMASAVRSAVAESKWSVEDVVGRPQLIGVVAYTNTAAQGDRILNLDFPFSDLNNPSERQRLLFLYQRFKSLRFKLMVNALPFHAGRLSLVWTPMATKSYGKWDWTGFPRIDMDVADGNPVELSVPYAALGPFLSNFTNNYGVSLLGSINVYVYTPLLTVEGASSSVDCTLYYWWEDPVLHIPKGGLVLQMMDDFDNVANGVKSGVKLAGELFDKPSVEETSVPMKFKLLGSLAHGEGVEKITRLSLFPNSSHHVVAGFNGGSDEDMDLYSICRRKMLQYMLPVGVSSSGALLHTFPVTPCVEASRSSAGVQASWYYTYLGYVSRGFAMYSGSIDYTFHIVASKFHSARFLVAFIPGVQFRPSMLMEDAASFPHLIMDLKEKKTFEFSCPMDLPITRAYCNAGRGGVDVQSIPYALPWCSGYVLVYAMNGLVRNNQVSDTIYFQIEVSAGKDFQLYFPIRTGGSNFNDYGSVGARFYVKDAAVLPYVPQVTKVAPKLMMEDLISLAPSDSELSSDSDDIVDSFAGMSMTEKKKILRYMKKEMQAEDDIGPNETGEIVTMEKGSAPARPLSLEMGENYSDLRVLLRRYGKSHIEIDMPLIRGPDSNRAPQKKLPIGFGVDPQFVSADIGYITGLVPSSVTSNYWTDSFLSYFSSIFCFWDGSIRYKFVFDKEAWQTSGFTHLYASYVPRPIMAEPVDSVGVSPTYALLDGTNGVIFHFPSSMIMNPTEVIDIERNRVFEVEVPYASVFSSLLTARNGSGDSLRFNGRLFVDVPVTDYNVALLSQNAHVDVYVAAGDDFKFHYLIPPPGVGRGNGDEPWSTMWGNTR